MRKRVHSYILHVSRHEWTVSAILGHEREEDYVSSGEGACERQAASAAPVHNENSRSV